MAIAFWVLVACCGGLMAYTFNIHRATRWVGSRLVEDDRMWMFLTDKGTALDFQSVVTPRSQNIRTTLYVTFLVVIVILGSTINWYLGIVGVIAAYAGAIIFTQFLPRRLSHYLKWLLVDLQHRIANLQRHNDEIRVQSLTMVYICVEELYAKAKTDGLDLMKLRKE